MMYIQFVIFVAHLVWLIILLQCLRQFTAVHSSQFIQPQVRPTCNGISALSSLIYHQIFW